MQHLALLAFQRLAHQETTSFLIDLGKEAMLVETLVQCFAPHGHGFTSMGHRLGNGERHVGLKVKRELSTQPSVAHTRTRPLPLCASQPRGFSGCLPLVPVRWALPASQSLLEQLQTSALRVVVGLDRSVGSGGIAQGLPASLAECFSLLFGHGLGFDGKLGEKLHPEEQIGHNARSAFVEVIGRGLFDATLANRTGMSSCTWSRRGANHRTNAARVAA